MNAESASPVREDYQPAGREITEKSSASPFSSRLLMLIALWALSVLIALISSHFGRYAIHTMSGDWAQDMVVVETHYHNAKLPQEEPLILDVNLEAPYPQWSFRLVAATATLFDLNPLRSIQIWAIVWLISGCYLIALRVVFLDQNVPPIGTTLFIALYLAFCAFIGFGFRGHIEGNFFFPQFTGSVFAIAGLAALQRFGWNDTFASLFIVLWGGFVLPNFHLIPAVWFTLSGIFVLLLRTNDLRLGLVYSVLIGLIAMLSWPNQGGSHMAQYANNNGWFLTRLGQLSDHGPQDAVGLSAVLLLVLLALLRVLRISPRQNLRRSLVPYAGAIAVCILICLQAAVYVFWHQGSVYVVLKYSYLLASEGAVLLASIHWRPVYAAERILARNPRLAESACVMLLFLAQGPFIATPDDQTPLMKIRARLLDVRRTFDPKHRTYPQFADFDYDRNFYLATAVMRLPLDTRTFNWLLRGAVGEEEFVWPDQMVAPNDRLKQIVVPNSGFESGVLAPWMLYGTVRANVTTDKHGGKFGLAETSGEGSAYQDVKGLQPSANYTVSAWVSGKPGTTATARIAAWDANSNIAKFSQTINPKADWTPIRLRMTASTRGTLRLHLVRGEGNGSIFWDDVELSPTR